MHLYRLEWEEILCFQQLVPLPGPEWTLVYTGTSTGSTSIGAIVGGSIAASVIITLLIVAIPLIIIIEKDQKTKKVS